jgi:hypothetical protein
MCEPGPPARRAGRQPGEASELLGSLLPGVPSCRRSCGTRCLLPETGFGEKPDSPFTQGIGEVLALLERHFDAGSGWHESAQSDLRWALTSSCSSIAPRNSAAPSSSCSSSVPWAATKAGTS